MSDVNMMTSLKALLFSSASTQLSPSAAPGVSAPPTGEGVDFAALFGAVGDMGEATAGAALPLPLPQTVDGDGTQGAGAAAIATLPLGTARMLGALQARTPIPLTVPLDPAADGIPAPTPMPLVEASAEAPVEQQPVMVPSPVMAALAPVEEPLPGPTKAAPKPEGGALPVPPNPDVVTAKAEPDRQDDGEVEDRDDQRADADPAPQPLALAMPVTVPPAVVAVRDQSLPPPPQGQKERLVLVPSMPPLPQAPVAAPVPGPVASGDTPLPAERAPAAPQNMPLSKAVDDSSPVTAQAVPVAAFQPGKAERAAASNAALPIPPSMPAGPAPVPATAGPVSPSVAVQKQAPVPAVSPASAPSVDDPLADQPVLAEASAAIPPAANRKAKPVKSEALSLLQLVREQFGQRVPAQRSGETVAGSGKADRLVERGDILPVSAPTGDQPPIASQPAAVQTAQPGPQITAQPVVDLSASLGAQVVDMGVSGQWIDGLARDIAGLSANGAQGRFQINADRLGPVQVDIRQGSDGAAVSLTVANEAAEMALRQDSDRLRLDASLSAVRISEVKVERAPPVAEAARTDSANPQSSQQQSSQTAHGWAHNSQNMAQSQQGQAQGQGRWQGRENSAFAAKNSGDPAVLNHDDTRRAGNDAVRARYA
ncbi:flagellar hook-length control protein FliK [Sphingobium estronivorans]|uniref:flagellar hook-length control protein FliK n=1 Tax=Sphingobium estronivorans TaxID=1577690 RepID=UPI00123BFC6A|nr:flagellar hook-length control protein FliK [Sphingobium estronivorans]